MLAHFINRELHRSVNRQVSASELEQAIITLLICSTDPIYVPISNLLEAGIDFQTGTWLRLAIDFGHIILVSGTPTIFEYIDTARLKYFHDADRYPFYFHGDLDRTQAPLQVKHADTTEALARSISSSLSASEATMILNNSYDKKLITKNAPTIMRTIDSREDRALTATLFDGERSESKLAIARLLSLHYTIHYMNETASDIVTGFSGLEYYDFISREFPRNDLKFYSWLLKRTGIAIRPRDDFVHIAEVIERRATGAHRSTTQQFAQIRWMLGEHAKHRSALLGLESTANRRVLFYNAVGDVAGRIGYADHSEDATSKSILSSLAARTPSLLQMVQTMTSQPAGSDRMPKTLVLVATVLEAKQLHQALQPYVKGPLVPSGGDYLSFHVRLHDLADIYIAQTEMSSDGSSGSTLTTSEFIRRVDPDFIIMAGICYGLRTDKGQKIGDIVVATRIKNYALRKFKDGVQLPRGDVLPAGPRLLNRLRLAQMSWAGCAIHSGLVVSAPYLADDPELISEIKNEEPEAEAGEMEGAGMSAAAFRGKVEWALIKGIADWGMRKDDQNQAAAADNAIGFLMHMIKCGLCRTID